MKQNYPYDGTITIEAENGIMVYYLRDDMMQKIVHITDDEPLKYFKKINIESGEHIKYRIYSYTKTMYYGGGDDDNASRYTATAYFMECKLTGLEIQLD